MKSSIAAGVVAELRGALIAAQTESFGVHFRYTHQLPDDDYNEVYPGIWVSSYYFAKSIPKLTNIGITHVLNCADGTGLVEDEYSFKFWVTTGSSFYDSTDIVYKGIRAEDNQRYNLSRHFDDCGDFIADALKNGGKVLVHCHQGVSRSATIAAAYLIKHKGLSAEQALVQIGSKRREINPNTNFLKLLSLYAGSERHCHTHL